MTKMTTTPGNEYSCIISAQITRKIVVRTKKVFNRKIDLSFAALVNEISPLFVVILKLIQNTINQVL